jgi:putative DNA primase/helicase
LAAVAVRLAPVTDRLAVTEGIETGLSYMEGSGVPTWAALSAGGIVALILPRHVRNVAIACDSDPVGVTAAQRAARRWRAEGRRVVICRPPAGRDFNDLARESLA